MTKAECAIPDPLKGVRCATCGRFNFGWRAHCMLCGHPFGPVDESDQFDMLRGAAVSIQPQEPHVAIVRGPWFDADRHEQAERVNGCVVCPECDITVPFFEEVEAWEEWDEHPGWWRATEWGPGFAECLECGCVFVDSFYGCEVLLPREQVTK